MVQFASRMDLLKGSEIRELLKLTAQPDILSFAGGMPAPELFPVEQMMEASIAVLKEHGREALQYSTTEGFPRLREQIAERMLAKNNIHTDKDHILVTSGSQQGLDFSARVFLNPGDVVLLESPSYLGAVNAFKACEPKFIEVPTDDGGMIMDELEKILATTERVKMIYVIPDFQNPTGRTWDLDRRHKFMEIINRYEIPVIEDNPYGELRFSGEDVPTIKSMDTEGRVLYAGSFSKVMAPAFRLGFLVFDKSLTMPLTIAKQTTDVHSNVLFQYVCNEYMTKYDFASHLEKSRSVYREKCRLMLDTMRRTFHPSVTFPQPEGGLFVMAFLPEGMDAQPFVREAIKRGVLCVPGSAFLADEKQISNAFRLNYSTPTDEQIVKGIEILGRLTHEWVKEH